MPGLSTVGETTIANDGDAAAGTSRFFALHLNAQDSPKFSANLSVIRKCRLNTRLPISGLA